jgi:uncharacterized membrane protein YdjX (TVP38/TMEM64 family)
VIPPRFRPLLKLGLLITFLAAAVAWLRLTETGRGITPQSVLEWLRGFDPLPATLVYVAVYIVGTVLLVPGTLLSFTGALLFGPYLGTLWTWIGATTGATLSFLLSRALGRESVNQLLGGKLQALEDRLRDNAFTGLLILRLIPIFPFTGLNLGCGLTSIRLRDFVLATAIGILPGTFVYQYLFATVGETILSEGIGANLWDPKLGIALGLFLVFLIVVRWLSRRFATKVVANHRDTENTEKKAGVTGN